MECYISERINRKRVWEMVTETKRTSGADIHAFTMYKDGECLIRAELPPYSITDKRQMYSISKSFTSTAIGFLCDMGKLKVTDRIADIFPSRLPEDPDEYVLSLTVKDLLTMTSGHEACAMPALVNTEDGVKAFLSKKLDYKPGTHFAYNTGATYVLSAIVTELTGMTMLDFLEEKLWQPLGIEPLMWQTTAGGESEGGIGLFVSCEDLAKLGLLYLKGGVWEGKRILSEEWVQEAQQFHSDNSGNGTPDWTSGYGYQFWRNARKGFRGDGAFGQYCIIIPEEKLVFTAVTFGRNMQQALDCICDFLENAFEPERKETDLEGLLASFYVPYGGDEKTEGFCPIYKCEENAQGFTLVMPKFEDGRFILTFSDGEKRHKITCGNGEWVTNRIDAYNFKPVLMGLAKANRFDTSEFAASWKKEGNAVRIAVRFTNAPHSGEVLVTPKGDSIEIQVEGFADGLKAGADKIIGRKL